MPDPKRVVGVLGVTQILAWAPPSICRPYLPGVLARPISVDSGWPLSLVVAGPSLGLLVSGVASPRVGRAIQTHGGRPAITLGSGLLGFGLLTLAAAPSLPAFFLTQHIVPMPPILLKRERLARRRLRLK